MSSAPNPTAEAGTEDVSSKVAARPSVLSLSIKEKGALHAAYIPFIVGGGLFVPPHRLAALGDLLYVILSLMDAPTKVAIPGKIAWITPAGATGRPQGIGIQFSKTDASEQARAKIEDLIGGAIKSSRPTNTA